MAVLVEALSLIIRRDAIEDRFPGGLRGFLRAVPNATACMDDDLVRVGFMVPAVCEQFVHGLESLGLVYLDSESARDMVICDQREGVLVDCAWIEVGRLPVGEGETVAAAWLYEGPQVGHGMHISSTTMKLHVPTGWVFQGSISQQGGFVEKGDLASDLEFLRREYGLDVYWDKHGQCEVFVARKEGSAPVAPPKWPS